MMDEERDRHPGEVVPDGWDQLSEAADDELAEELYQPEDAADELPAIPLIAGSWGDLALILGVCVAALMALKVAGHGVPFAAAGWALAVAALWWMVAAGVLIMIRHGTPGMLLSGVQFAGPVPPRRIGGVVLVALILCATLGIPAAVGRPGWALRAAAGCDVVTTGHDGP
jgi:hypothetical protein